VEFHQWRMKIAWWNLTWGEDFFEYCLKFLINFGLGFLDVEGKIFPWCRRQWIYLVRKTRILLYIEGKVFLIAEVMSILCLLMNRIWNFINRHCYRGFGGFCLKSHLSDSIVENTRFLSLRFLPCGEEKDS